jgi:hypothetical protein
MKNQSPSFISQLLTVVVAIAAILWSATRLMAWLSFSIATYIQALVEACHAVALKETQDVEMMYNFINYPDEVSPNL